MTNFPPDYPEDENRNDFEADDSADKPEDDVWDELFTEPWADALLDAEPNPWDDLWADPWIEAWEEPEYHITNLAPDDALSPAELEAAASAEAELDYSPKWLTIIITILLIAALTFPLVAPMLYSQQNTVPRPQPSPTPTSPIIFSA
jgi:hypothetical protein